MVIGFDIRTGFDFSAVERQDYSSANRLLREEWSFWRKTAPAYRFGRTELMPIRSSEEAIGRYIGKYIGKHMEAREDADKGARLVRYSRGARVASTVSSLLRMVASNGARSSRRLPIMFQSVLVAIQQWMVFVLCAGLAGLTITES